MKPSEYARQRFDEAEKSDDYPTGEYICDPGLEKRILALLEAVEADNDDPSWVEVQLQAYMNTDALERILEAALALKEATDGKK